MEWHILGIHGADCKTVEGNVARVRMVLEDRIIDEDFSLPEVPAVIPREVLEPVYTAMLQPQIEARMRALAAGAPPQADQVVDDDHIVPSGSLEVARAKATPTLEERLAELEARLKP